MSGDDWQFQGAVDDESSDGLVVQFGGIAPAGIQATVLNGTFAITFSWTNPPTGTVTSSVTDWWGLEAVGLSTFVDPEI